MKINIANCLGTNYIGTDAQLRWCVQDALDLGAFSKLHKFNTEIILENDVTSSSFVNSLYELCNNARKGVIDGFIHTHSGHGTKDYNINEPDFYNEGLWFKDGVVLDDELRDILNMIPDGLPNLIFWDVCFSGGMLRWVYGARAKYYPPPIAIPIRAKRKHSFCRGELGNENYISACKEGEVSYDADPLKNGAGTDSLLRAYTEDNQLFAWHNNIGLYLPSEEYPQSPQLICKEENKTKKYFSWFNPVTTDIPDIPPTPTPPPAVVEGLCWLQKVLRWIKKILGL